MKISFRFFYLLGMEVKTEKTSSTINTVSIQVL